MKNDAATQAASEQETTPEGINPAIAEFAMLMDIVVKAKKSVYSAPKGSTPAYYVDKLLEHALILAELDHDNLSEKDKIDSCILAAHVANFACLIALKMREVIHNAEESKA